MKTKNTIENNNSKEKTINSNNNVDYYEKFLKEKVNTLENILERYDNTDTEKKTLSAKIVAYQECYVQYLLYKR